MRTIASILVVLLLVSGGTFSAWARSEKERGAQAPPSSGVSAADAAKCMEDFDMRRIIDEPRFTDSVNATDKRLFEYIWCRSVVDSAFATQYNVFNWLSGQPNGDYEMYSFWTQFSFEGKMSPSFIMGSTRANDLSVEDSRVFLEGFLERDPSACGRMSKQNSPALCRAMLSLDTREASNKKDRDFIYYLRALADYDVKECNKISRGYVRATCQAVLASDPNICEKCPSFKSFKRTYCSY